MNSSSILTLFPIVSILYFPPLYVWITQKYLYKIRWITYPIITFPAGALLSGLLYINYHAPGFIVTYLIFMLFNIIGYLNKIERVMSFSLSIYASFAISELWELPIHIYNWSNYSMFENGIILFLLKSIAIAIFFREVYSEGWRPTPTWWVTLLVTFQIGLMMYAMYPLTLWNQPLYGWHMYLHLYRVPWIILFAWCLKPRIEV